MQNKKLIQFAQSFLLLPVLTISTSIGIVPKSDVDTTAKNVPIVLLQKQNTGVLSLIAFNQVVDKEAKILEIKANAIDTYFREHNMPLEGTGMKMVEEAEKNDLDWRLLAAIAVRESTGGRNQCKRVSHNFFGWGSCKIGFKSDDEAIEVVARNLGGNNPNTAHHYSGKETKEILQKYNPPSIVLRYAQQVIAIMNDMGHAEVVLADDINNT